MVSLATILARAIPPSTQIGAIVAQVSFTRTRFTKANFAGIGFAETGFAKRRSASGVARRTSPGFA
jgi:hypothetical protein